MNVIFVILVIISPVVAFEHLTDYQKLCKDQPDLRISKVTSLIKLVKSRRFGIIDNDCQYSVGFQFNTEMCQTIKNNISPGYNSKAFSAFLSDDDEYLYIYHSLNILWNSGQSPEKAEATLRLRGFKFGNISPDGFLIVVWLKEKRIANSNNSYRIDYKESEKLVNKSITTEKLVTKTDRQLILRDINTLESYELSISYASESSSDTSTKSLDKIITIKDSYIIFCGLISDFKFFNPKCKTIEVNERIRCDCTYDSTYSCLLVLLVFWLVILLISFSLLAGSYKELDKTKKSETEFKVLHNCTDRNVKFKYIIDIRLAKTSFDFDLKDVTIDVELFTHNNESIAPNFRFKAKVMDKKPVTDIKLWMFRLTKMPELLRIQCSHSGKPEGKICLLGINKKCFIGETDKKLYSYKLVKSICRTPRQFNLRKCRLDEEAAQPEDKPLKHMTVCKMSISVLEVMMIMVTNILFMGFISSFIPLDFTQNVFLQMLVLIVSTTICGIAFNALLLLFYKWLLLMELKQQLKMHLQNERICFIVIRCFYGLCLTATIVFTIFIGYKHFNDFFIVIYRWIAVIVCSSALVALVWCVSFHKWDDWFPLKESQSEMSLTVNSASVNEPTV